MMLLRQILAYLAAPIVASVEARQHQKLVLNESS